MTIREAINRADTLTPNQYADDLKIAWLSELDYRVFNEIMITHEGNMFTLADPVPPGQIKIAFPYTDDSTELLVDAPYDVMYSSYIKAKIDEANEETARYANSAAQYNSEFSDYARFYNRTHLPLQVKYGHRPIPPAPKPYPGMDEHPSPTSKNPVMSCGIYYALQDKADKNEIPENITDLQTDSNHQTVSAAEKAAWNDKQDALTFDTAPTSGSDNPVKSGGVKSALDEKADASDVPKYLQDLANLLISNPQPNQVIKFINGLWQNADESGGALPIASADTLGGVKVGSNLTITEDGTLNATGGGTLPIASASTLGGIKVGANLTVAEDGTLSAPGGGTSDYDDLTDKPQINGVTLSGNKSLADLGIEKAAVEVTGTLTAGQTGITLSNVAITTSSTIDIYTDTYGVNPTGVTVANGSITLTFAAQASNLGVKAVVK